MPVHFLNVDLDIESSADMTPLIEAFHPAAYSMERAPGLASFELDGERPDEPEGLILEFIRLIVGLPPAARALWDGATRRTFDIGIDSGLTPWATQWRLSSTTLRQAADVGADIVITVYEVDEFDLRENT